MTETMVSWLLPCCNRHVATNGVLSPTTCGECGRNLVVRDRVWQAIATDPLDPAFVWIHSLIALRLELPDSVWQDVYQKSMALVEQINTLGENLQKLIGEKGEAEALLGEYGAGGTPAGLVPGIHNLQSMRERAEGSQHPSRNRIAHAIMKAFEDRYDRSTNEGSFDPDTCWRAADEVIAALVSELTGDTFVAEFHPRLIGPARFVNATTDDERAGR